VLKELLKAWRDDGYDYDQLELWVIGGPGELAFVPGLVQGTDVTALEDNTDMTRNAGVAAGATLFDLVVLDQQNVVQLKLKTFILNDEEGSQDLEKPEVRQQLDDTVRSLLGE
jgi:hypothetical protein